jgi:hypothetical protein
VSSFISLFANFRCGFSPIVLISLTRLPVNAFSLNNIYPRSDPFHCFKPFRTVVCCSNWTQVFLSTWPDPMEQYFYFISSISACGPLAMALDIRIATALLAALKWYIWIPRMSDARNGCWILRPKFVHNLTRVECSNIIPRSFPVNLTGNPHQRVNSLVIPQYINPFHAMRHQQRPSTKYITVYSFP